MRHLALSLLLGLSLPTMTSGQSTDAQIRAREQARDDGRAQGQGVAREVADLQRQLVALGAAQSQGERVVGAGRERLKLLDAREQELSARLGQNQVQLARLLSALQSFRRDPPPALLVSPRSARDAVRATILINAITPELRARGAALKAEADELQRLRRGVAQVSGALFQAESDAADRRTRIERLIADKRSLQRRLLADADRAEAEANRLATRARSLGELTKSLPAPGALAVGAPSRLTPPAQGPVVRRFGDRWEGHPRAAGWAWRTLAGAQVVAPAEGRVDYAGPLKGWGGVVILSLGGDYRVVLSGLETAQVGVGQTVAAGEPVGRLPAQGGPAELYVELRRGGAAVDPAPLFTVAAAPKTAP